MRLGQTAASIQAARGLPAPVVGDRLPDIAERLAVLALFAVFVHRLLPPLSSLLLIEHAHPELLWQAAGINAQVVLLVFAEALGVALIVLRRSSPSLSQHTLDWALALAAVSLPLLFARPAAVATPIAVFIATGLMLIGLAVQISAKLALWRSFGVVPANRGVKTRGPYRLLGIPCMPDTHSPISGFCSASRRSPMRCSVRRCWRSMWRASCGRKRCLSAMPATAPMRCTCATACCRGYSSGVAKCFAALSGLPAMTGLDPPRRITP